MLSREDNELPCRIGPGTPMGALMRQYWIPAALSSELPEPEGAPVRLRLLGESLVAFRVSSGAVGLIQNHCPHRGASLFYGRNEDEGLRCVHHGLQDQAVTESMGPIDDRTQEHLATSDLMVIRTRRRLLDAAKALRDEGQTPPGVDVPHI